MLSTTLEYDQIHLNLSVEDHQQGGKINFN